jgi:hypothetical protein
LSKFSKRRCAQSKRPEHGARQQRLSSRPRLLNCELN